MGRGAGGFPPPQGNALIGDVANGKIFSSLLAGLGKTGTAAGILGNALAADVASGKTFSSAAAGSNIAGSLQRSVYLTALTSRTTQSQTPVSMKKITINSGGTLQISFDVGVSNISSPWSAQAQIYKNGVAVGILRNTTTGGVNYVENLSCVVNDIFELYCYANLNGAGGTPIVYVANFIIQIPVTSPSGGVVNVD